MVLEEAQNFGATRVMPLCLHGLSDELHNLSGGGASSYLEEQVTSQKKKIRAYEREALEFVLELAGPRRRIPAAAVPASARRQEYHPLVKEGGGVDVDISLVRADDLPVPLFAVDSLMRCVLWNKRAADLSGWLEPDLVQMPRFASTIFTQDLTSFHNQKSGECKEEFEDFLQAASEGHGSSGGEIWKMRTKWGHDLKVLLLASMCTDSGGVMSGGTMCVIMPLMMLGLHLDCNIPPLDDVQDIDTEEEQLSSGNESPRDSDDEDLVPPEQPQSPSSEGGVDGLEMFCDPGTTALHGSSVCSQDWCKSEKGAQVSPGSKSGEQTLSCSARSRVMVVDPQSSGRKSLTLMLERCGIEVTEACSSKEALWQFEQTLHKPDAGFSVLFMDLAVASADDYAAVCEIRQAEHKDFGGSRFTPQVLIVAVTNHDRWELANMEEYIQMGLEMGIDAIISRPSRVQQLRNILSDLGVCSEFLNKSPQAKSRCWQSPLILVRYQ